MKPCPTCAREIEGDASVCPHCGREVGTGEAPEALVRVGDRYLLGYGTAFFGIWDRESPREPIERFPRDDGGEREAIARFELLERHGAPTPTQEAAAPARADPPPPAPAPATAAPAPPAAKNTQAAAALILGIVGTLAGGSGAWQPGLLLGLLALGFGAVGLRTAATTGEGRGQATAGLALGLLAMLLGFFGLAAGFETTGELSSGFWGAGALPDATPGGEP